jgi:hypothetical protein
MIRLLGLLATLTTVTVAATSAQKLALTGQNRNCDGSLASGASGGGWFVIFVGTGSNKLSSKRCRAECNTRQRLRLSAHQFPTEDNYCGWNGGSSFSYEGQLTTDSSGNGNANIQDTLQIRPLTPSTRLTTPVIFTSPRHWQPSKVGMGALEGYCAGRPNSVTALSFFFSISALDGMNVGTQTGSRCSVTFHTQERATWCSTRRRTFGMPYSLRATQLFVVA